MTLDRRTLIGSLATMGALSPFLALESAMAQVTADPAAKAADAHMKLMSVPGLVMHGNEQVVMLLYPGFTALDLVGPHYFFASMMGARVHLVSTGADLAPVPSDLGLAIQPTMTLAQAPRDPTVVFVPGGTTGTLDAAEDPALRRYLRDASARAQTVVSVCTGALVLGAAGLLRGRRATSHWVARDTLAHFGATPVDARVVTDGKIVTGAGVSAGLDLGVAMVAQLRGRPYAEAIMLQAEYHPEPPFPGGTPTTTPAPIAGPMRDMFAPFVDRALRLPVDP
ncbi:DJ-1/PfpI family protein [Phenylobacterium sp.]|uniref:DJ-1/PfpI family protein n=1 Tax=Phenylobacterium sp. TaxID=1871053 RepID=UPI003D29E831